MTVRYVAVEGVDGAGKTTVARRLVERFEQSGVGVRFVREPGGTMTGEAIRRVLLDRGGVVAPWTEALLFAAGRAQLADELIGPAIDDGFLVISDRTVYSSLAYQGGARGLGIDLVRSVNAAGLQGIWPELVILLDMDPAAALAREDTADRISVEGVDLQRRVAAAYAQVAAAEPDRFVVLDASQPLDTVVDAAEAAIRERM